MSRGLGDVYKRQSNILNANFDGANLIGATWTMGEICGPESIGICNK